MTAAWFPKIIDPDSIPAIRSLGKHGISFKPTTDMIPGMAAIAVGFADNRPFSLAEQRVRNTVPQTLWLPLAAILADGPKLFVIPDDMIDDLNQVEIPLTVKDYCQPFPACIVKSEDEYHYVVQNNSRIMCVTASDAGIVDNLNFFAPDVSMETNLGNEKGPVWKHVELDSQRTAMYPLDSDQFLPHRFRATLNFLLLVTAGGFQIEHSSTKEYKRQRQDYKTKYTVPKIFVPQEINLWRTKLINANHRGESDGTGTKKSPHWRRAHWRRVATGAGRSKRELRLIPCCLVNKRFLNESADTANSEYRCQ